MQWIRAFTMHYWLVHIITPLAILGAVVGVIYTIARLVTRGNDA